MYLNFNDEYVKGKRFYVIYIIPWSRAEVKGKRFYMIYIIPWSRAHVNQPILKYILICQVNTSKYYTPDEDDTYNTIDN